MKKDNEVNDLAPREKEEIIPSRSQAVLSTTSRKDSNLAKEQIENQTKKERKTPCQQTFQFVPYKPSAIRTDRAVAAMTDWRGTAMMAAPRPLATIRILREIEEQRNLEKRLQQL